MATCIEKVMELAQAYGWAAADHDHYRNDESLNAKEMAEQELRAGLVALSAARPNELIRLDERCEKHPQSEPMFWVRLCSDGGYEGPIHNKKIEEVRKQSGAWHPLYLSAAPAAQPSLTAEEIASHGAAVSKMLAKDMTRFDAACEVMAYLRGIRAPHYYVHRMHIVLHGNPDQPVNTESAAPAAQPEPVAWCLGNPRYAHSSNVFLDHEFTPDYEHRDEWTPLYLSAAPAAQPEGLSNIRSLIADDSYAMTFQSLGQYRSALLSAMLAW
jgi:hypothetical protein